MILSKTDLANSKMQQHLIKNPKTLTRQLRLFQAIIVMCESIVTIRTWYLYDPCNKSQDVKDWLAAEQYEGSQGHDHRNESEPHHSDVNRHGDRI